MERINVKDFDTFEKIANLLKQAGLKSNMSKF